MTAMNSEPPLEPWLVIEQQSQRDEDWKKQNAE
jgi:hypothetical protein